MTMLMRSDPFRELERLTQHVLGTAAHPAVMRMDAWRDGDKFFVEFDLPGVRADSLQIDVERDVLTVRAERPEADSGRDVLVSERPHGVFSRQLFLGDILDADNIHADYTDGVLRLTIPVAAHAKSRKIAVTIGAQKAISA
jgi:HSP20 family protein